MAHASVTYLAQRNLCTPLKQSIVSLIQLSLLKAIKEDSIGHKDEQYTGWSQSKEAVCGTLSDDE